MSEKMWNILTLVSWVGICVVLLTETESDAVPIRLTRLVLI